MRRLFVALIALSSFACSQERPAPTTAGGDREKAQLARAAFLSSRSIAAC